MSIIDPLCCGFAKVCAFNIFQEKATLKKLDEENDRMYKSRILKEKYAKFNAYFDGNDKMQIEYSKFKGNFPKIVENIKSLEKRNRPAKDEILSTFSQNRWVKIATEDQSQHSLSDCSRCLKTDKLRKVLAKFPIKNIYLKKKGRNSGFYKDTVLKDLTNLFVTTLDRSFNAAFDVSFSKCAGINKNDQSRCNNEKLANSVNACAIKRETAKLVKENIENQWAETVVER